MLTMLKAAEHAAAAERPPPLIERGELPEAGLSEVLVGQDRHGWEGSGAISFAMPLIARLTRAGGNVALVDRAGGWHPPAFERAGVDLRNLILLRPRSRREGVWAIEQCCRSKAVALTFAPVFGLKSMEARRLLLASREGGGRCLLLRPESEPGMPSALRMKITPLAASGERCAARRLQVNVLRWQWGRPPEAMVLKVNDEAGALELPLLSRPQLAAAGA